MNEPFSERDKLLLVELAEQRKCHHENYRLLAKSRDRYEREGVRARLEADLLRLELESIPPLLRWLGKWF
ncbi:MAG: hypothetical protein V3S76_00525 [Candidatus Bipolaricaulota bacterium]